MGQWSRSGAVDEFVFDERWIDERRVGVVMMMMMMMMMIMNDADNDDNDE